MRALALLLSLPLLAAPMPSGAEGAPSAPPPHAIVSGAPPSPAAADVTVELSDRATGRRIYSHVMHDGETAILTWTNSLFRLPVTEVFVARAGALELTAITYGDPSGRPPPRVQPRDVDDLYQTGGPFHAEGMARAVRRVVFRVGEVGHPALRIGDREIRFLDEVGFGGAVVLEAR